MINDSHNRTILTEDTEKTPLGVHLNDKYDPVHLLRLSHIATFQNYLEVKHFTPMWDAMLKEADEKGYGEFRIYTPWQCNSDCFDMLTTIINYSKKREDKEYTIGVTEYLLAPSLSGTYHVESPLFHCATKEELLDFLIDRSTPFKRYKHLEHIMTRLYESSEAHASACRMAKITPTIKDE